MPLISLVMQQFKVVVDKMDVPTYSKYGYTFTGEGEDWYTMLPIQELMEFAICVGEVSQRSFPFDTMVVTDGTGPPGFQPFTLRIPGSTKPHDELCAHAN